MRVREREVINLVQDTAANYFRCASLRIKQLTTKGLRCDEQLVTPYNKLTEYTDRMLNL